MRFEVFDKKSMEKLSKELSKAGIMNRTKEEISWDIEHFIVIKGTHKELREKIKKIGKGKAIEEKLEKLERALDTLLSEGNVNESEDTEEVFDEEVDTSRLTLLTAVMDEKLKLLKKPEVEIEIGFPIEDVEEIRDKIEEEIGCRLSIEIAFSRRYFVEVLEVDMDLIHKALEIAKEYVMDELLAEAMIVGTAKSVLADAIMELVKQKRKKNELIDAIIEMEPITVDGEKGRINIYYDEKVLEDLLKELQSLGYIKIKGNKILW